jgi:hypothetical protein
MPAPSPSVTHHRAVVGALSRDRAPDDPALLDAKRSLAAANISAYITRVLDAAPTLTREQVDSLHVLLEPARRELSMQGGELIHAPPGDTQSAVPGGSTAPTNRQDVIDARIAELGGGAA